jgi:hypothetical protein
MGSTDWVRIRWWAVMKPSGSVRGGEFLDCPSSVSSEGTYYSCFVEVRLIWLIEIKLALILNPVV